MESASTPTSQGSALPFAPPVVGGKPARVLACVLCQHRKIKCDRTFPCANCIKSQITCTPSTPAPARKRKRPNQDLQERLARCEDLLKRYGAGKPPDGQSPRPSITSASDDLRWQPAGQLVKEDGNVRFVDSPMIQAVFNEVRTMRAMMADDESEDSGPETMTPDDNSDLLLGGEVPGVDVDNFWPVPAHAILLWQIYLDRVNPLTKIIHVPSLQPYMSQLHTGTQTLTKSLEALFLAIFLMAVVSLTPDECRGMLGDSREKLLQVYTSAVCSSLRRIGFLRNHNFTVLQALVIYLISLQGRYNRHAVWILNGVAVRIAQKMGLHRDGEALGLPPFDCEMRRRLWWQIIMLDAKYAMFSGLSHTLLPTNCDTGPPKNLDDADIFPTATEPFQDRDGPTEMIFCLLTYTFAKFLMDTPGFEGMAMITEGDSDGSGGGPTEEQLVEYRREVTRLRAELVEILDKYSDLRAGPVHEMAITMREHLEHPDWGREVKSAEDNTFKHVVGIFEHDEANYLSTQDKGFTWFSLLHFQIDLFTYMAGQLCRRTEGNLVERAWKQASTVYTYHPELFDVSNKKYATVGSYLLRAWRKREQLLAPVTNGPVPVPFFIEKLRSCIPEPESREGEQTPASLYTPPDLMNGVISFNGMQMDNPMDHFVQLFDGHQMDWDMFGVDGAVANPFGPFNVGLPPPPAWQ